MIQPNPNLIADLARLAARYPAEDWEELARFLRDPGRLAEVAELAERLASVSPRRGGRTPRGGRPPGVREALVRLRAEDPVRADLLEEIWTKLRKRELLPEMRAVRSFAEATGLKALKATKRDQAVAEVMRHVVDLHPGELVSALRLASAPERALGDEYARWVQLILNQDPSQTGPDVPELGPDAESDAGG